MKCQGKFIFKCIEKKEGGEFVNQKGQKVVYDPTFQVKVDEIIDGKTEERIFKFKASNKELANNFEKFNVYDKVIIDFNIELYKTSVKLVPCNVYGTEEG